MAYWLLKEEPEDYSFQDLVNDRRARWEGVKNAVALTHLRSVRRKDRAFFYETGKIRAVVGVVEVVRGPYPDPELSEPKFVVIDVRALEPLPRPVTLAEIKKYSQENSDVMFRPPAPRPGKTTVRALGARRANRAAEATYPSPRACARS